MKNVNPENKEVHQMFYYIIILSKLYKTSGIVVRVGRKAHDSLARSSRSQLDLSFLYFLNELGYHFSSLVITRLTS